MKNDRDLLSGWQVVETKVELRNDAGERAVLRVVGGAARLEVITDEYRIDVPGSLMQMYRPANESIRLSVTADAGEFMVDPNTRLEQARIIMNAIKNAPLTKTDAAPPEQTFTFYARDPRDDIEPKKDT